MSTSGLSLFFQHNLMKPIELMQGVMLPHFWLYYPGRYTGEGKEKSSNSLLDSSEVQKPKLPLRPVTYVILFSPTSSDPPFFFCNSLYSGTLKSRGVREQKRGYGILRRGDSTGEYSVKHYT